MKIKDQEKELVVIAEKYKTLSPYLSEATRRIWAATEARAYGLGGIALVCKATGMSNTTICKGLKELKSQNTLDKARIRKEGGGRKSIKERNPSILRALEALVDPTSKGDPESPLKWTSKSTKNLAEELNNQGYEVCPRTVSKLLKELGYSLQANKKSLEGKSHEDRNAQFNYINKTMEEAISRGEPCISVDTKKKENLGEFKNNGREYAPQGEPVKVKTHDFPDEIKGKAVPYGVYDIGKNAGWVSVGVSGDTAEFAVNSIRTWWYTMGREAYRDAKAITLTADCGGSNGYRVRMWKHELQKLADELQMTMVVRHFPPGTSKWNKIEHRLFSYISKNWRGKPLISKETVVNLIGNTKTSTGLKVMAVLDENIYETGKKVDESTMEKLCIIKDTFHPEWNYAIYPSTKAQEI